MYDIGVSKWDYRKFFDCDYYTVDRDEKRKPDSLVDFDIESFETFGIPENCPPDADGILLNGIFEQSDDPFTLMRNVSTVLKTNGKLLAGLISIDAPWKSDRDKWRVTKSGALEYCKGFHIDELYELPGYYYVLGTKE